MLNIAEAASCAAIIANMMMRVPTPMLSFAWFTLWSTASLEFVTVLFPFIAAVCILLGAYPGHCFTTKPFPRPLPDWLSLPLFLGIPYIAAVIALTREVEFLKGSVAGQTMADYPLVFTILWLSVGATIGSVLLHQTK